MQRVNLIIALDEALHQAEIEAEGGFNTHPRHTDEWTEAAAYKVLRDRIKAIIDHLRAGS